jgi:hypothetical protein
MRRDVQRLARHVWIALLLAALAAGCSTLDPQPEPHGFAPQKAAYWVKVPKNADNEQDGVIVGLRIPW